MGGATSILYIDCLEGASEARPTIDVDCIVEVGSIREYHQAEERMRRLGFSNDTSEGAPICRWKKGPLVVDLMPTDQKILGFSNQWYAEGFKKADSVELAESVMISIFTFPYFVASKLEALLSRGVKDLSISQDLEDILFVMEGRESFLADMKSGPRPILEFATKGFAQIVKVPDFEFAVRGNLPRGITPQRERQILELFESVYL